MADEITVEERKFLDLLASTKKVVFNWGDDSLWVSVNGDYSKPENMIGVFGERYHEISNTSALSSADTVYVLVKQGYDVEIRNAKSSFFDQAAIDAFIEEAKSLVTENLR
jgi:hypothetical protein